MADKPIRLLISDVDGTLVTRDKIITDAARAAVADLRQAGVAFTVTSARPPRGVAMVIDALDLDLPVAGFNGGLLVAPDMSVLEAWPIDPTAARDIVAFLLARGFDVWVYDEDNWYLRDAKAPHAEREAWIIKLDPVIVTHFPDDLLVRTFKIVGISDDAALVAASEQAAQDLLAGRASATRSTAYFLDVTHPHANKGEVVATLARRLDISTDEVATIGDMMNDVPMFRRSGFSVAMGNAGDVVKAEAKAVTTSNENEGFAGAVHTFILPRAAS